MFSLQVRSSLNRSQRPHYITLGRVWLNWDCDIILIIYLSLFCLYRYLNSIVGRLWYLRKVFLSDVLITLKLYSVRIFTDVSSEQFSLEYTLNTNTNTNFHTIIVTVIILNVWMLLKMNDVQNRTLFHYVKRCYTKYKLNVQDHRTYDQYIWRCGSQNKNIFISPYLKSPKRKILNLYIFILFKLSLIRPNLNSLPKKLPLLNIIFTICLSQTY